ncbi:MAG: hypothetical protein HY999_05595 [Nitrospinae bacterium]|nr:hypothetical protein [Nitrospinota bacterium]
MRPAESREVFVKKGWSTIAALQLRNPMHRSHEYLGNKKPLLNDRFIERIIGRK